MEAVHVDLAEMELHCANRLGTGEVLLAKQQAFKDRHLEDKQTHTRHACCTPTDSIILTYEDSGQRSGETCPPDAG